MRFVFLLFAATAFAQTPEATFQTQCATCHNAASNTGAPLPGTLRKMSWKAILTALETGKMAGIGNALTAAQRESVAKFLGIAEGPPLAASAQCTAPQKGRITAEFSNWNGWADPANTRFQNAGVAGLTRESVPKLKLKWAFGFPGVATSFGTPTIWLGSLYVGDANGVVYALDASTGCVRWTYTAAAGVRVAPAVGNSMVYFGDLRGNVYALSQVTGVLAWKARADEHAGAVITGSPKLNAGRLYVAVSGRDESLAATNPAYECCTYRGSLVAIDARTGRRIWRAYTVTETPRVTGKNKAGAQTWGPSGVAIWSSPTLDLAKKAVYVGTGVNYSKPTTSLSDAIVAFDMATGRLLWSRQFTTNDSWNFACTGADKTNCPADPFVDSDLGNSGILRTLPGGRRVLLAADKGGTVYGIDPDRQGAVLWTKKIAAGGVNGGFMWGGASDPQGVAYLGISDFTAGKPEVGGGLIALQLATGEKLWTAPAPKPTCIATPGCSAAQPAPVTAIPGVAFLGSWDGHIRAYDTRGGAIVWDFDTAREFPAVGGGKARGGSITATAPVAAGGMLYIASGYSGNAMPGNALLAFSIEGK